MSSGAREGSWHIPRAWLCVCFQEPEVSELESVRSANHGTQLPQDTREQEASGRASSMPRLTMEPQVKSDHHLPPQHPGL